MVLRNRRPEVLTFADSNFTVSPVFTDYFHTVHPETGLEVVYVPGEAKPQFVLDREVVEARAAEEVQVERAARRKGNKAVTSQEDLA